MPTENSLSDNFDRPRLWSTLDYLVLAFMALSPVVFRSFNLLGFLIILVSIIVVIRYRDDIPAPSRETKWLYFILAANLLLAVINVAIGRDPVDIVKDPLRLIGMIPIILAVSITGLRTDRLFVGLAAGMIGASMAVGYQVHISEIHRGGEVYNPNPFSEVAMVSGAALLSSIVLFRGWRRTLTILGALAAFYCVLVSETRGTLLAILPMGMVSLVALFRFRNFGEVLREAARRKKVLGIGVLFLLAAAGLGIKFSGGVIERFNTAFEEYSVYAKDRSQFTGVGIRLELWYSSWLAFKEAPLTGIGSDNRRAYISDLESKGIVHLRGRPWKHNHSDYFDSLIRQGLPGMLIVIGLYWILFVSYWRSFRNSTREQFVLALAGLLTVTGYATFSVTEVPLRNSLTLVFFVVLNAVLLGMLRRSRAERVGSVRAADSPGAEPAR